MEPFVNSPKAPSSWKRVGQSVTRADAVEKALGRTLFGDDFHPPGCLYGRALRSAVASADILSIDTRAAKEVPGVRAVLTAEDVPGINLCSGKDFPILAKGHVRSVGDVVALVAAETPEAAEEGLRAIRVEYRPREGVYGALEALERDPKGAEIGHYRLERGDVEGALAEADVLVEGAYRTPQADHCFIEPEAGVAWVDSTGVINIRWPTQLIENYRTVAKFLGLPSNRVRVQSPMVGGGFGGKEQPLVAAFLALLALKTGRPVRIALSREETFLGGSKKHPFLMRYRTGARRDGTLTVMDVEVVADAGAYATNTSLIVLGAMVLAQGPYRVENVRAVVRGALTNNPFSDAMRGVGCNQMTFAVESQMEALAEALRMDPIALREKNYLRKGDRLPVGQVIEHHVDLPRLAREVERALGPPTPAPAGKRVGRGYSANMTGYGRPLSFAEAYVALEPDGSALIRIGTSDLGAGQASAYCQIVADELGLPLERVAILHSDSGATPFVGYTASSRQTLMSGRALQSAAATLRASLLQGAAELLEARQEDLCLEGGRVCGVGVPEKSLPYSEVIAYCQAKGLPRAATGSFKTPTHTYPEAERYGGWAGWTDYTWGFHGAEVMVDEETGEVRLLKFVASHDVGKAINPVSVEGQIEGGAVMGIGYALTEETVMREGRLANPVLHDYLIPTSLDLGEWRTLFTESGEGMGPYGARGIGEPPCNASPAAIANAVSNAIGARVREFPITPERVLQALNRRP